jgi:hypothetical protein
MNDCGDLTDGDVGLMRMVVFGEWDPERAKVELKLSGRTRCVRIPSCHQMDTARLSGSRLLLDETVRTGLTFGTKRESEGTRTSKSRSLSTHARLYLRGHVTAKGNAGHWLWPLLWTPLRALPPRLHVPLLQVATPSLRSQLYARRKVYTRHLCLTLTLTHAPPEACP